MMMKENIITLQQQLKLSLLVDMDSCEAFPPGTIDSPNISLAPRLRQ